MKKIFETAALAASAMLFMAGTEYKGSPSFMSDAEIEKKVENTLAGMSLEEKIGQMTQINLTVLGSWQNGDFVLDENILNNVLIDYKVGSILNAPDKAVTPQKWHEIISKIQEKSLTATGIPCLYGLDHIHGCTYIDGATLFPQDVNIGASFNTELARTAAQITAYESRACSVPYTFSPTIDLTRSQAWSRIWENFGEDPLLNTKMGLAAVEGYQGKDWNHIDNHHVAVSLKHFMGYGAAVSGKDRTPSSITPQDMREKYFAPYKECALAGALSVMVNSGNNAGMPFHANWEYLTQWLKEDLAWDGVIITDWADINNLYTREKIAADKKEAIMLAINAGIDLAMEPYSCDFCDILKELVNEGSVKMSRIDDAVRRVLRMKYRLGLFDEPVQKLEDYPDFACKAHRAAALAAAEESIVLLKNEGVLPLAEGKRILVTGPNANSMRCINGGWSYSWQGHLADSYAGEYNTVYEALCARFGASNVRLEQGVTWDETSDWMGGWEAENEPKIRKAVSAAKSADVIVACIGENSYCETPGNLSDLNISASQIELVKALEATGKPVVLVLIGGRPRIINSIVPEAKAVVDAFLPGNFGGDAIAALLAGDVNFSAMMPYTYPKAANSLINYDYKPSQQVSTMEGAYNYAADASSEWPFGYGISYTDWTYSDLKAEKTQFTAGDVLKFTVDVTNSGAVAGKEPVLLFSSDLVASTSPDIRRLRAFKKVELAAGQKTTVEFEIPAKDLAFVGYDCKWRLEKGDFTIQIGDQTVTVTCTETKVWDTPNI